MGAQLPPGFTPDAPGPVRLDFNVDMGAGRIVPAPEAPAPSELPAGFVVDEAPEAPPPEPPVVPGAGVPTGYVPPSTGEEMLNGLHLGAQATGRGLADLAGAPVDLAALGINAGAAGVEKLATGVRGLGNMAADNAFGTEPIHLPRIEQPALGSEDIAAGASAVGEHYGVPTIDPDTLSPANKLEYQANRFGANALATGAGVLRPLAMSRAAEVSRAPRTFDTLLAPYENGSAAPLAGDVAGGVGSGSAVAAGDQYLPDKAKGPFSSFILSLLGGLGGSTALNVARAPGSVARSFDSLSPESKLPYLEDGEGGQIAVTKGAADRAARYVQNQSDNPSVAAKNIPEKAQSFRDQGLPVPTTGALSGDVGLGAVEQGDRVRNPVPYQRADQRVRSVASDQLRSVAPVNAEPRAATEFVGKDAKQRTAAAADQVAQAEKTNLGALAAEQTVAAPYREPANAQAASRALDKTVVDNTLKPRTVEKNAKFAAIPDAERDVSPMVTAAAKVRDTLGALNNPSAILPEGTLKRIEALAPRTTETPGEPATFKVDQQGVSEKVSGGPVVEKTGGIVSFQDLNKLRPELSDAILAARKAGNYTLADNLKALKREINGEAERMAASGSPEAKDALTYFKDEFAPYFGQGTTGGALRKDINGDVNRLATPPSGTAERFLFTGAGSKEAAADLRRILEIAPSPEEGQKAVRSYVLSDLAKTVETNGTINPQRLKDWMNKRADMLSEFPAIDAEVQKLRQDVVNSRGKSNATAAELKKAMESAKLTEKDIQGGNLSLLLDSAPDVAVSKVFGANDPKAAMRGIVKSLGKDKAAAEGWKKAVSDYLVKKLTGTNTQLTESGDANVQYAAMAKMLRDHRDTLAEAYTPEEMNALQKAHKLLEPFGALGRRATAGSPTAENNTVAWRTLEAGMKAYFGVLKGGGIMRSIKLAASTLPDNSREVELLVHKMQFDPEVAVHLLNRPLAEVGTPGWNAKLNRYLGLEAASREDTKDKK